MIAAGSDPDSGEVGGLVGKVTSVTGGTAEVTLITDASIGVGAQVMPSGATGVVRPAVGNPRDLLMEFVEGGRVTENTTVATSGFTISKGESLFPRGIPIGRVSKVDLEEVDIYQRVHLEPYADLKSIDIVQVLTRRPRGVADRRGGAPVILSPGAILRVGRAAAARGGAPALRAEPARHPRRPHRPRRAGRGGGRLLRRLGARAAPRASPPASCSTSLSGATMGVSSLVLTAVGYGVGRFREVRDPSHGLLPLAVGGRGHGRLRGRVRRRVVHA